MRKRLVVINNAACINNVIYFSNFNGRVCLCNVSELYVYKQSFEYLVFNISNYL